MMNLPLKEEEFCDINMANEKLRRLVEIIDRENYKFPFKIRDPLGIRGIAEIRKKILEERKNGTTKTIDFFGEIFNLQNVQELLNLKAPQISDLGSYVGVEEGKIYGLEFRLMGPQNSHKDLMIAALTLMKFMTPTLPRENMDTIADAGFFNSALATKFYAQHFGLKGAYFIQESTPKHLIDRLQGPNFEVNLVSNVGTWHDQKNATYMALLKRFHSDPNFKKRTYHLGHAEMGQFAVYPIGRNFVKLLQEREIKPDIMISPIGAGTTIMGIGEPIQDFFGTELGIVECTEYHPVAEKLGFPAQKIAEYPNTISKKERDSVTQEDNAYRGVISRQLELNPFLPEDFWGRITQLYQLEPNIDYALLKHLHKRRYNTGETTAVALSVASSLVKNENKTVLIPVFETFRDYRPRD